MSVSCEFSSMSQSSWVWPMWKYIWDWIFVHVRLGNKLWAIVYLLKASRKAFNTPSHHCPPPIVLALHHLLAGCIETSDCSKCLLCALHPHLLLLGGVPLVCPFPLIFWKCFSCVCLCLFLPSVQSNLFNLKSQPLLQLARKQGLSNQKLYFSRYKYLRKGGGVDRNVFTLIQSILFC
jgi:hypothetical protein